MISLSWVNFKALISTNNAIPVIIEGADSWMFYAGVGGIKFQSVVYKGDSEESDFISNYQPSWAAKSGRDSQGRIKVIKKPSYETTKYTYTHNYTDKCTWYQNSNRIIGGSLVPKVSGVFDVYKLQHTDIIDLTHGRLFDEDNVQGDYSCRIYVNNTEVYPYIDYAKGEATFSPALTSNDVVTADYSYATNNEFIVAPYPGKKLNLLGTELKLSIGTDFSNRVFILAEYGYDPNNLPNKISYKKTLYKSFSDLFVDSSTQAFKKIQDFGALGMYHFSWPRDYVRELKSSVGAELRLSLYNTNSNDNSTILTNTNTNSATGKGEIGIVKFIFSVDDDV